MKWFRTCLLYLPGLGLIAAIAFLSGFEWRLEVINVRILPLVLSLALMLSFFTIRAALWQQLLRDQALPCSFEQALLSLWRTSLVKYLPGKIWIVLGPADIINRATKHPLVRVSLVALVQIGLSVWAGVTLGMPLLAKATGLSWVPSLIAAVASLGLGLWALQRQATIIAKLPARIRRRFATSLSPVKVGLISLFIAFVQWLVLGAAFAIFFHGLGNPLLVSTILWQPLANATGIAVPLSPGGLGVRESVMLFYLSLEGLDWTAIFALVIWSRLWVLAAEFLTFITSFWLKQTRKF